MQMHCVIPWIIHVDSSQRPAAKLFFLHPRPISLTDCVCCDKEVKHTHSRIHAFTIRLPSLPVSLNAIVLALVCVLLLHDFIPTSCAHSLHQSDIHIAATCFPTMRRQMFARKSMKLSTEIYIEGARESRSKTTFHLACPLISHMLDWLMTALMPFDSIVIKSGVLAYSY